MPIKFAARGISAQFQDPLSLAVTDGVVLKPRHGHDVFVWSTSSQTVNVGVYIAPDGGAKVNGEEYNDIQALQSVGLYVLDDVKPGFDCWETTPQSVYVCTAPSVNSEGINERMYLYHGQMRSLDEAHYIGVLFGGSPEAVSVHGVAGGPFSGDSGVRYGNDDGYFVKCTSRPDNSEYYATIEECEADWSAVL